MSCLIGSSQQKYEVGTVTRPTFETRLLRGKKLRLRDT